MSQTTNENIVNNVSAIISVDGGLAAEERISHPQVREEAIF